MNTKLLLAVSSVILITILTLHIRTKNSALLSRKDEITRIINTEKNRLNQLTAKKNEITKQKIDEKFFEIKKVKTIDDPDRIRNILIIEDYQSIRKNVNSEKNSKGKLSELFKNTIKESYDIEAKENGK